MLQTNVDVMRAQTNAQLPKMSEIEGVMMRGTWRSVAGRIRPKFIMRLLAQLPRNRRRVRRAAIGQPSLSSR